MLTNLLEVICKNSNGVEIGGPSYTGTVIYRNVNNLDNVIFSPNTVWSNHTDKYNYYENKPGSVIINDATDIKSVATGKYDFYFLPIV